MGRSQGQTLAHVIVDIASPLTDTLSLFRSHGRENIQLPSLVDEDKQLGNLNIETEWFEQMVDYVILEHIK